MCPLALLREEFLVKNLDNRSKERKPGSTTQFTPSPFTSLVELLRHRARRQPDRRAYTFLKDGETDEVHLTYGQLDRQARAIAGHLQRKDLGGRRVLLLYPPGLDYIAAFFGALYAGCVAVPAYPPRINRPDPRLEAMVLDSQAVVALTTPSILAGLSRRSENNPALAALQWLSTETLAGDASDSWRDPGSGGHTLALLQYTSGSTTTPKGVMVSHANLLHNQQIIQTAFQHTPETILVSWLPLYHDMGLIGSILQPLYVGFPCILMSPLSFLQKPLRWLQAISRYRATTSGGPDFAYHLCARRVSAEQRAELDLSSWNIAFNGAEMVRAETLEQFSTAFAACGFQPHAFFPCYGLAEATLMVSGGPAEIPPSILTVQAEGMARDEVIARGPHEASEKESRTLVSCGPWLDQEIIIVDPATSTPCPPHQIGEIWVSGPGVAQGYWNRPAETDHTFRAFLADTGGGPFLRTGDLGFVANGELYLTGRLKDLIIIRGRNYYPQDIELTAEQAHPALQPGAGAAFSVDGDGEEQLALVYELQRRHRHADTEEVALAIRRAVADTHELQVHAIALLKPGTVAKTSSGKIQRHVNRERFLRGELDSIGLSMLDTPSLESAGETAGETVADTALSPPRTPLEKQLAEIWREVLQLDTIDIRQNFFALGGHSLLATQLVSRIRERLRVELPLYVILESPTIAALARHIQTTPPETPPQPAPVIPPVPRTAPLPLSFSQERMWFLYQFEPNNVAYHVSIAVRLVGSLDAAVLERCFNRVVQRHEILRTTFAGGKGRPVQQVAPPQPLKLAVQDLQSTPPAEREQQVRQLAAEDVQQPFDMAGGPLLRVTLFRLGVEDHVVLVVLHHIISDAWSLSLLWQEIASLYRSFLAQKPASLPDLPIQYADFAHWQRRSMSGDALEGQLAYWKQQLAGAPLVLDLPTDRPRPAIQTSRGAYQSFSLPPRLLQSLRRLSQQEEATLFMTLLAAFKTLLYRYTGQADLLVGTPIANRHRLAVENLLGTFVNTLVMRANLSGDPTFRELLRRVRATALDAYEHQDLSFEQLVEELQPGRDLSHAPLIQVMFSMANPPMPVVNLPNLTWRIFEFDRGAAQFDLTLSVVDTRQVQLMAVEYNTDLFDEATISRMMGHFQTLLEGIAASAGEQPLSALPLLTPAEESQLRVEWNNTALAYPAESCLHQLFERQAVQTPHAIAVIFEEEQITYGDLNRRANQLAHHLKSFNLEPDTPVGIFVDRSVEMVVALLGVLKAGGAYLPLAPTYPRQRLALMIEDAQAAVLLTQQHLLDNLPGQETPVICLDKDWAAIAAHSDQNPACPVSPENLAYVIYTSGSTGTPKGVQIPHRAVVNFLISMQQTPGLTPDDILLSVTTLSFDIAVLELFLPLITGARVVIAGRETASDGPRLLELLAESGATVMQATPATWRLLLQSGWAGSNRLKILCGGEALPRALADQLLDKCAALWNMYGPTETTVWSTAYRVEAGEGAVSIGRPIGNTRIYILDSNLRLTPIGVPGELYIGGDGLARGYHNRPQLTAEKFITDPLSDDPQARLYKTGDLARYLPDGNLEFLGRLDHQVKIRGFRIELGEIETVLTRHPNVAQAVALVREADDPAGKQLAAYVVPHQDTPLAADELREFLQQHLPDYMVPAVFVPLDALPLTPNGKVNRLALPEPVWDRSNLGQAFIAPRTEIEKIVAGIWAEVLSIDEIGVVDNFFELGGHSLLVTQVMARVNQTFQLNLPLRAFFEAPTVGALALIIEEALIAEIDDLTDEQAQQLVQNAGD